MNESYTLPVGIDCGSQIHQVCVLNTSQAVVGERRVAHTGADIQALADWLLTLGETDPSQILVAIEVPRGPLVEALLERGFRVWAINPKQLDRFRVRGAAAGAKDDQRDAWVLASAVQTDRYAFGAFVVDDPQIIQLRGLSASHGSRLSRHPAALAGLAPVTKASGTRRVVVMRYACNARSRTACYHWARVAVHTDVPVYPGRLTKGWGVRRRPRALSSFETNVSGRRG